MYMTSTGSLPTSSTSAFPPDTAATTAAGTDQADAARLAGAMDNPEDQDDKNSLADGIGKHDAASNRITMSHGGRILSKSDDSGKDAATKAIEDSKYPEEIKKLMIRIRELQQQLREKAAELQEVAADQKLPSRQREMKVAAIRDAVGTITSAIQSATATLNDTMTVMRLSSDDRKEIATMISGAA